MADTWKEVSAPEKKRITPTDIQIKVHGKRYAC